MILVEAKGFTFNELAANTEEVLGSASYKSSPANYRFEDIKYNEMRGLKYVSFDTKTFSKESNKHYNTSIFFYNVDLENGEVPDLNNNPVRVSCSCPSYYFYSWYWNKVNGAHARGGLKPYVRKTEHLPERNPSHLPCLCKHLLAFGDFLNGSEYFTRSPIAKAYKPFNTRDPEKRFGYDSENNPNTGSTS